MGDNEVKWPAWVVLAGLTVFALLLVPFHHLLVAVGVAVAVWALVGMGIVFYRDVQAYQRSVYVRYRKAQKRARRINAEALRRLR